MTKLIQLAKQNHELVFLLTTPINISFATTKTYYQRFRLFRNHLNILRQNVSAKYYSD